MIEFIDVIVDIPEHNRLGDLEIQLTSPMGTTSVLAEKHEQRFEVFRYKNWRFGTMEHFFEKAQGEWVPKVADVRSGQWGNLVSWKIKIYGHYD